MGRKKRNFTCMHMRSAATFKDRLHEAKLNRIKLGLDRKMISDTRLTKALAEDPDFESVMKKLERKPRRESLF